MKSLIMKTFNMNLAPWRKHIAVLIGLILHLAKGQLNPIFATSAPGGGSSSTNNVFYFDSKSDCNTGVRNLFGKKATIIGSNQTASSSSSGVTTCTIILKSEGTYDGTILDINVVAMNILDCSTQVSIYDGEGANILLSSFDCRSSQNANRRQFVTSKNTATFIMNRPNPNSYNFDVQITVEPISSGPVLPTNGYGLVDFTKFPQEGIVGMISGFYVFVLAFCIAVIVFKNRSFKGANAKWEIHELANVKTGLNFDSKSQLSRPVQISTLEGMKNREPGSQYSRSTTRPTAPQSEDGDSGVYYNEETFQRKQLMTKERENIKNRFVANTAFSDKDDDTDNFREKTIIPSKHKARNVKPPPYDEAVSDNTSEHSSDEESELSSKRSHSSEEEESERSVHSRSSRRSSVRSGSSERSRSTARTRSTRSPTPSETESEEESQSDEASSRGHRGKRRRRKPRQKHHPEPKRQHRPTHPQQTLPQPAQQLQQPPMHPPMYGAYPPGQYVPVMAGPQFQPVQMVPGYPPPHYAIQPQAAVAPPRETQIQPTDIPVYSYLVQRGYKPVEDLNPSHASSDSQRSGGHRLENPDIWLGSGVEYMKR